MWSSKLRDFENSSNFVALDEEESLPIQNKFPTDIAEYKIPSPDSSLKEMIGYGIGITSILTEVLVSHPFLVLRHQCQVRSRCKQSHLLPFSLFPILTNYTSNQGIFTLWKGISGVLTVRAFYMITENLIAEVFGLPKDVSIYSCYRKIFLHIVLKAASWIICTPFYAASIVEFVQSDIASEPSTLISCTTEGFRRLLPFPSSPRLGSLAGNLKAGLKSIPVRTSRLLPIWKLVVPVVVFGVGQHIVRSFVGFFATAYLRPDEELEQVEIAHSNIPPAASINEKVVASHREQTALQSIYSRYYEELIATLWSSLAADVLLYPLETIIIRLCVQGTRTLVDNLDSGISVLPIVSAYDGFLDALRSALNTGNGLTELYRGFGALILQYTVQAVFLFGVKCAYEKLLFYYSSAPVTLPHTSTHSNSSLTTTVDNRSQSTTKATPVWATNAPPPNNPIQTVWQPFSDQNRWNSAPRADISSHPSRADTTNPTIATPHNPFPFRGYTNILSDSL